jgi:hypothetical protein
MIPYTAKEENPNKNKSPKFISDNTTPKLNGINAHPIKLTTKVKIGANKKKKN